MTTSQGMVGGEQQVEMAREQARGVVPTEAPQEQAAERTLNDSLGRMMDSVRAEAIFGSPIEREGVTIIPCSEVMMGFGMGGGSGFGPTPTSGQAEHAARPSEGASGGGGIGGGGGAQGRPVAVIAVSQGRARVVPVVDATKLMLAGLTAAGFVTFWLTQVLARSGAPRPPAFSAARFARAMRSTRS